MASPLDRIPLSGAVTLCGAVLLAAPLAQSGYFPGFDLPFHAVAVAAGRGDMLFTEHAGYGWSYLTMYGLAGALHAVGLGAAMALQVVIALYVLGFVWGAARLLRAFDAHPALALCAAPAAYSVVLSYGFLPFALGYPIAFALWAYVRERHVIGVGVCALLLAITHPLAAGFGAVGGAALLAAGWDRDQGKRIATVAAVMAIGLIPAVVAVLQLPADQSLPPLLRDASLWERWWAPDRPALAASVGEAASRLFHVAPAGARAYVIALLLGCAAAMLAIGGRRERRGLAAEVLLGVLVVAYFASPYTLDAPYVIAIQPRLLPMIWVVGLVALRVDREARRPRAVLIPPVVGAMVAAAAVAVAMTRFSRLAEEFEVVTARSDDGVKTLVLVEHDPVADDAPPSPWRSFGGHLMAEHGGYVSHAFFAGARWLPIVRADGASPPRAPPLGRPHEFDWDRHADGWDQFLIRDIPPDHDWFGEHRGDVELVLGASKWSLYRRR